jgi:uncharacterized protein (TIGR03000 family)
LSVFGVAPTHGGTTVTKRTILATALILLTAGADAAKADLFRGPWDLSLGPYYAPPPYSYNVAYGYGLPFGGYQLYNPFDPYQNPGHGAYYPHESYYSSPPYGQELYYGPRLLFRDRGYPPPGPGPVIIPTLEPVPVAAEGTSVTVSVNVPANAEVWFDGQKTNQTGPDRVFHSPPLRPGIGYMYLVRAKWSEGGRETEQVQTITVHAGERVVVAFPLAH